MQIVVIQRLISRISAVLLVVGVFVFIGCQKDPSQPSNNDPSANGTNSASGFTWTPYGSSPVSANDFYFISAYNNIVAGKTGNLTSVDIILDDLSLGTHTLSPSKGITLEYLYSGTTYSAKSGAVNITKNTGTQLSGNFNAVLNGGAVGSLSGEFVDVPVK